MSSIDSLEHGGGGFAVRHAGMIWNVADPREKHYQWVLMALQLRHVPDLGITMPQWKADAIFERWCAAWDLPDFDAARRLAYFVDHYADALTNDLIVHAGLDLGEEWRARRWGRLLAVIDRLPGHAHFPAALANDEEYASMVAKAAAARGETRPGSKGDDTGPALTTWSPEVAMLASILDAVNNVRYATIAVQAGKKAGEPPKPTRRPITALEKAMRRAEYDRRKAAHDSLVARVLPHKAAVKP